MQGKHVAPAKHVQSFQQEWIAARYHTAYIQVCSDLLLDNGKLKNNVG